jgi:predicted transcriptional regulator of viral defense system
MTKYERMTSLLKKNNGFLKTSDASENGISKTYFLQFVRKNNLERVAHGLYLSDNAWDDGMYVIQYRYPEAIFSHETALYLLNMGDREPLSYSLTLPTNKNTTELTKQGTKVHKIKKALFELGLMTAITPAGNSVRVYNAERTLCDLVRSRRNIDPQDFHAALRNYIRREGKNIPLLLRYADAFSVGKIMRQYMEALLG